MGIGRQLEGLEAFPCKSHLLQQRPLLPVRYGGRMGAADETTWIDGIPAWEELEGGFWSLLAEQDDATGRESIRLTGSALDGPAARALLASGRRLRAHGSPGEEAASIFMTGPAWHVTRLEPLEGCSSAEGGLDGLGEDAE